jgi:putative serine protease PepD
MRRTVNRAAAVVAAGALAAGGAAAGYLAHDAQHDSSSPASAAATTDSSAQPAASQSTLSVNQIYRDARNGVVEVLATQQSSPSPFPGGGDGSQQAQAQGSGFVYDGDGHIVTNEHVVDGASSVSVRFASGQTVRAQVVGTDQSTDVAVLKVDNLPSSAKALTMGNAGSLEVGDGVVAIGSPFGLAETVTSGIVSALDREIQSPNNFAIEGAIQTDAAINHGNSGGPLLDMHGHVVGVNSQIESDSGGNDGVGFAIPSSTVKSIADRLIAGGKIEHAYLGVSPADAAGDSGATLRRVANGTPAASAGLETGDVVTEVDGEKITSSQDLRRVIDEHNPGDKVKVTVRRAGDTKSVTVTLGTRPAA